MNIFKQFNSVRAIKAKNLSNRGDTIVEVLIAIAIVSVILVGAFVTSNKSTQAVRNSQEHAEAAQLLKSQIEQARIIIENSSSDLTDPLETSNTLFCIDVTQSVPTLVPFNGSYPGNGAALKPIAGDVFSAYPANCRKTQGGYSYNVAVENSKTSTAGLLPNTLLFHARWDSLGGGHNEVTFSYRDHPGN
jgi:prepilin-type N-terminal cleavage/methylation domain-containing protein